MNTSEINGRDRQIIAEAMRDWENAFCSETPESILALYADDACLWGTLSPVQRTDRESVRDYFDQAFIYQNRKVVFNDVYIRCYGDTAVSSGSYTFSFLKEGETLTIPSRFSFAYVRHDGRWLIVEHHSSLMPEGL
jgi:uncharacterized protein (TIGR02246 family)